MRQFVADNNKLKGSECHTLSPIYRYHLYMSLYMFICLYMHINICIYVDMHTIMYVHTIL